MNTMNIFKHLYNKILTERRHFVKQEYYYHGTTTKYLKSILVNGLAPDNKNTIYEPSKYLLDYQPYGGAYLSKSMSEAIGYSYDKIEHKNKTISDKLKYKKITEEPVIILCHVSPYSGYLDEDSFTHFLHGEVNTLLFDMGKSNVMQSVKLFSEKLDEYSKIIFAKFKENFKNYSFEDELIYPIIKSVTYSVIFDDKKKFRESINKLTVAMKKNINMFGTARFKESIGFSGRNKIVAIFKMELGEKPGKGVFGDNKTYTSYVIENISLIYKNKDHMEKINDVLHEMNRLYKNETVVI